MKSKKRKPPEGLESQEFTDLSEESTGSIFLNNGSLVFGETSAFDLGVTGTDTTVAWSTDVQDTSYAQSEEGSLASTVSATEGTHITEETTIRKRFSLPIEVANQIAEDSKRIAVKTMREYADSQLKFLRKEILLLKQSSEVLIDKGILQKKVIEKIHDLLFTKHKGEFVALTYEGNIVASSTNENKLISEVYSLKLSGNQVFIYSVPLK